MGHCDCLRAAVDVELREHALDVRLDGLLALNAGSYSVGDSGPSGYAATHSTDCTGSIAVGETKTCTVTNDDIPAKLIVIKHVINDNGGSKSASDFTMSVTGASASPTSFAGAESPGTNVALNAGSYAVGEAGPSGYAADYSADCTGSIAIGETKTCTVTNTHTKSATSTSTAQSLIPNDSATISGRAPVGGR